MYSLNDIHKIHKNQRTKHTSIYNAAERICTQENTSEKQAEHVNEANNGNEHDMNKMVMNEM